MSLAEHLDATLAPERVDVDSEHQRFVIDGPKTADWALRKCAHIRARMAENEALAAEEWARIKDWLAAENSKLERDAAFFTGLLTEYHRTVLDAEPDRKTIALPAGKLVARKQPDRWQFDTDAFIAWAIRAGHDELVRRPAPEVDRAEAKRLFKVRDGIVVDPASGEAPQGVSVEPGDVRFTVEVS